jgi:outer membrane protein assembly factor BamB
MSTSDWIIKKMKYNKQILTLIILLFCVWLFVAHQDNSISMIELKKEKWSFRFTEPVVSQPFIQKSAIITQTNTKIFANDLIDGSKLWESQLLVNNDAFSDSKNMLPVAFDESAIVFQTQQNTISLVNSVNGSVAWKSDTTSTTHYGSSLVFDTAIDSKQVFVSRRNTSIASYAVDNGSLIWEKAAPERTGLVILLDAEKVYLGTDESILVYDRDDGQKLAEKKFDGLVVEYAYDEGYIFIAFRGGRCSFAAFATENLEMIWCVKPSDSPALSFGANILVDNQNVYFASNRLVSISKVSGEILWSIKANNNFNAIVITSNSNLYVTDSKKLLVIDGKSGKVITGIKLPTKYPVLDIFKDPVYQPVITDDYIYLYDQDGLTAYENPIPHSK